jgi:pilus assembly protein FimV
LKQGFLKLAPRWLLGVALTLLSGAAMALGLGEIRVKSQPGQPLVAEIPVISNEPGELEQLQARLASPVTFERVGLARPEGLVSGLNFAVALNDEGKPVIRVTSTEPVQVAAVNFLIEVDWGQGRLVREYSALVNAPGALTAGNQPIIDAPVPPPSNVILREPEPVAAAPVAPIPAPAAEPVPPAPETAVAPAPVARTESPAPAPAPIPAATSGEVQVQRGQTLSQIARDLGQGYHLDQTMLALLRANPDAFINNNINRLKQGAVLRVPQSAELAQLGEAEATALVRDQMAEWRQARRPIPQPAESGVPLAAASQPIIDAPLPPPANTIVREPEPIAATEPAPAAATVPAPTAVPAPATAAPATAPTPRAPAVAPSSTLASGELEVQRGQTLSQIARDLGPGYSLDQTMLALLRANPDAFINGNINRLKQGAVLRLPQSEEQARLGESEAAALVRDQMAEWRQARRPIPQPVESTTATVALAPASAATKAPRVAEARLEIAPPAASAATRAGTQSGIDAEGEGDMLANQQLTLTKEELAARESEVQELRAQVAELESIKQQQGKLIAMKDSELAAAQQRLAKSQGDASQPLWMWAGLGLLVAGLVVGWLISRRKPVAVGPKRSGYDSAALAAAMPVAENTREEVAETVDATVETQIEDEIPATLAEDESEPRSTAAPTSSFSPQAWTTAAIKPTWHTGDGGLNVAPLNAAPAGRERLELAIAYLDLGDLETARDLLNEVVAGGDDAARNEATQLLREIG